MATHEVFFKTPERKLGKADVKFSVWRDGEKFGTLTVSNGSLVWFPKDVTKGHKINWARFDRLIKDNVQTEERRK